MLLSGAVFSAAAAAVHDAAVLPAVGAALLVTAAALWKPTFSWPGILTVLFLVIFFIPIKRYEFALGLPFQVDPYRIAFAGIAVLWLLALLADPDVRLRRTPIDVAVMAVALTATLSIAVNLDRFEAMEAIATKTTLFFASYFVLYFLITSVAPAPGAVEKLLKVLVAAGGLVAALAVLETRTGVNPYDFVLSGVPILVASPFEILWEDRGIRATGSAEHPIAMGAALVMLVPLAIHFGRKTGRVGWWAAALLLAAAGFATLSRTILVMLVVVGVVFFWLKRDATIKAVPLVVPLVVATHFLVPGALGTIKALFLPEEGLIAQQSTQWATVDPASPIACTFTGRAADIGPSLDQAVQKPVLGYGFGTRLTRDDAATGIAANACVLDNQWLGTLLDVGVLGLLAWCWLFLRFVRRAGAAARGADEDTAWLLTALTASVAAYAVAMLLFDSFSFVQVTLLLFILLAFGGTVLRWAEQKSEERRSSPA